MRTRPRPEALRVRPLLAALLLVAPLVGVDCARGTEPMAVQYLGVRVVAELPHDPEAFTQGLLWHGGKLYESTGLNGHSSLRRVDPASGAVEQSQALPEELFGEGLARVGDRLVQLTWRHGEARYYDLSTFRLERRASYPGEGWGLCFDGRDLVMSDGSASLVRRDPASFAETGRLEVRLDGVPVGGLNELECAEGWIYANVWKSDRILRIDPGSGDVVAVIDAAPLRARFDRPPGPDAVLNGIAYRDTTATFLLTGKFWPLVFEVVFVE